MEGTKPAPESTAEESQEEGQESRGRPPHTPAGGHTFGPFFFIVVPPGSHSVPAERFNPLLMASPSDARRILQSRVAILCRAPGATHNSDDSALSQINKASEQSTISRFDSNCFIFTG